MLTANKLTPEKLDVDIRDPFFIFEFHNVFDPVTYAELDSKFPKKALFPATWVDRGGKSHMNSKMAEFADFTSKTPVWMKLYENFSDPRIVRKLYELAHSVPSERPANEKKPWQLTAEQKNKGVFRKPVSKLKRMAHSLKGRTPVRLTFEFSYLESGCYLPPHTDVPGKLISLMIYFPDKDVKYPIGSGTEFYRGKNSTDADAGWAQGMMDDELTKKFHDRHETFYTSDFGPNKLVGFIKTSNSWHGLHTLRLPDGATRRSLNVNYYLA